MEKKKIYLLVFGLICPFFYNLFSFLYYNILSLQDFYYQEAFIKYVEENPNFLDAMFCIVVMILYLPFYIKFIKKDEEDKALKIKLDFKKVIYCIIIAFAIAALSMLWFFLIQNYFAENSFIQGSTKEFDEAFSVTHSLSSYFWDFLSIALLGPIVEEMIFRGISYSALEKVKKGIFPIIVTGILFGIWHLIFVQVIYTAIAGILFALIYYYTKNIYFCMLLHVVNNFLSFISGIISDEVILNVLASIQFMAILPCIIIILKLRKEHLNKLELIKL